LRGRGRLRRGRGREGEGRGRGEGGEREGGEGTGERRGELDGELTPPIVYVPLLVQRPGSKCSFALYSCSGC